MWSLIEIHQIAFEKMGGQKVQAAETDPDPDPDPETETADPETSQTHKAAHLRGS